MSPSTWSDWQPLRGLPPMSALALAEILDGGQAFCWHSRNLAGEGTHSPSAFPTKNGGGVPSPRELSAPIWQGIWQENIVRLRLGAGNHISWSTPAAETEATRSALATYFAVDRDFAAAADSLPWRSDQHLARCLERFRGLRILRQPFGETLLGFLCSATKQIVQIKQMLALLAERHGTPLALPLPLATSHLPLSVAHRLPTWPELARIPEADLRACLLGFRAKFIRETALFLATRPDWLEETELLPYSAAKERLCQLPGVGEKIADCVLLFGAGRLEAFPVDTWILRALARHYGLDGWKPSQVAQFGRAHFGPLSGLAQQYLFAWERFSLRENLP